MDFHSPTYGKLSFRQMFGSLVDYMSEVPDQQYHLIIGTDSLLSDQTCFVTAVIVHRVGHGGRYFYRKMFNRKMESLRQRILFERPSAWKPPGFSARNSPGMVIPSCLWRFTSTSGPMGTPSGSSARWWAWSPDQAISRSPSRTRTGRAKSRTNTPNRRNRGNGKSRKREEHRYFGCSHRASAFPCFRVSVSH